MNALRKNCCAKLNGLYGKRSRMNETRLPRKGGMFLTRSRSLHVPVLLNEMIQWIDPSPDGVYLDGTLGRGGYSRKLLEVTEPTGMVIAFDLDKRAVDAAQERFLEYGDRFMAIHAGFQDAKEVLERMSIKNLNAAVLDLGLSSDQLDDPERGFSFQWPGPLDMRFNSDDRTTLLELISRSSVKQLEEIILTYGEERYFRRISKAICSARDKGRLQTTKDLAEVIKGAVKRTEKRIHPATRTFQAFRIAVNKEIQNLEKALEEIPEILAPGGKFCVISYHSIEDRAVKNSFRERARTSDKWTVMTKKPIRPGPDEVRSNPRSRSAKMRVLEVKT